MSNILEVQNLAKHYGDFEAVKGISFSIKEGEIFSLLDPMVRGKRPPSQCSPHFTPPHPVMRP
jgi:ABC-type branched-subunit amino acid transport system ATPase component